MFRKLFTLMIGWDQGNPERKYTLFLGTYNVDSTSPSINIQASVEDRIEKASKWAFSNDLHLKFLEFSEIHEKHKVKIECEDFITCCGNRISVKLIYRDLFTELLDELKEKRRYWKLREEALGLPKCRTCFGRSYGPVVRQTTE